MRHLPVLWLTLVLTVLVTNRCAFCSPTISQLKQLIDMILFEDKLHNDILSEKVILEKTNDKLPKRIGEMVKDLNNVDPLVSLHALHTPHPYYSGENLNVSLTIVGKSIMCLTYKRVAFHLAMMISLIERQDHDQLQMRLNMLGYVIPFYIDMLSSIFRNYDDLLNVYDTVKGAKSDELTEKLKSLNEVIKSSCVVNEMKLYCSSFNLKSLNNCEYMFTDENKISLELNVDTIIETLMENENAILNYVDEMDSLRNMGMSTWKVLLKTPDLPPVSDEKAFVRTPLPVHPYRDEVKSIITE